MSEYGLQDDDKQIILDILTTYPQIEEGVLFGSRALNTFKTTSDIDLAIKGKDTNSILAALMADFEESNLIYEVDLVDYASISTEKLLEHIDQHGKVFYRKGWIEVTLGEVVNIYSGKTRPKQQGVFPVYGGNGILNYGDNFNQEGETIVIGRVGAYCGNVFYETEKFWLSDNALGIKVTDSSFAKFFYYKLVSMKLNRRAIGAAQPLLTQTLLNELEIHIPPLSEQKSIANMLSSFDEKIELLREQNKTLETLAQTIFKEWFVNFNYPGATGEMVDSELGEIPKGWRVGKLGEVTNIKGGGTPSTKNGNFWGGQIHWTSPKDLSISKSTFLLDTEKKITEAGLSKISSGLLPKGTLLLSSRAPIGYLAISNVDISINQGYIALLDNAVFPNYFMFLWLKINMRLVTNAANGSTFLEISKTAFKDIMCVIPDEKAIGAFQAIMVTTFDKILLNIKQAETLEKHRNNILPKLMEGQTRVEGDEQ